MTSYSLFDRLDPARSFAERFPYALNTYIVSPPREDDQVPNFTFDFSSPWLQAFLQRYPLQAGDILEVMLLNRRVQLQGVRITVQRTVDELMLRLFTNSGAPFEVIDCSLPSSHIYLPYGGVLDRAGSLTNRAFVIDNPDFVGLQIDSIAGDISRLILQVDLVYSTSFNGLGLNNENLPRPVAN